ncbi:ArsR family transcriptional regulator [Sphingobacterium sp. WQ 366]|uniref:ArsR family transcriptional regulator n=2 Tax=Sphingobacterium bovistauri TaxID=2781959 RepID=A0ABS7Z1S6_9SPHI|nr:ArsR family transcriptional regulator [Sphingobacterium bovistauri]MCA5004081.1 ArsR family transcriptional regulator [Sphingobacterium bovistauri]
MLDSLITSKTRLKLLIKFFVSANNRGYLRGIAEEFNESTNSIRKELNHLTDAGYLIREEGEQKVFYKANTEHTLFGSLQGLIHNFLGFDQMLEQVLGRDGNVEEVALLGDYAQGIDSGHIEIVVLGKNIDSLYLLHSGDKAEGLLDKRVSVYTQVPECTRIKIILYQRDII